MEQSVTKLYNLLPGSVVRFPGAPDHYKLKGFDGTVSHLYFYRPDGEYKGQEVIWSMAWNEVIHCPDLELATLGA